ncbi:acyltransferase family protein [Muricoccus aerilatus]|uniref:acyltransferase family protein n=1 Tax=Muricoccus aerilatus TaxID=452982 RepID=UPI000A02AA11|nr:acyltransferase [Roseomonas aerilata]
MQNQATVSANINAWRFLLITCVVFNHSFSLYNNLPSAEAVSTLDYAVNAITRMAVPTLSVLSGYFFLRTEKRTYLDVIRKKVQSLLAPFLLWNTIPCLAFLILNEVIQIVPDMLLRNVDCHRLLEMAVASTGSPVNGPLYFLRDLFVCFVMFGLVKRWLGRPIILGAALAIAVLNYKFDLAGMIIIRNSIPLFFLLGMGWHTLFHFERSSKRMVGLLGALAVAMVTICTLFPKISGEGSWIALISYCTLSRLVIALIHLRPAPKRLAHWGRDYAFTVFLSHWFVMKILLVIWRPFALPGVTFELLAPIVTVIVGIGIKDALDGTPDWVSGIVTGGRSEAPSMLADSQNGIVTLSSSG